MAVTTYWELQGPCTWGPSASGLMTWSRVRLPAWPRLIAISSACDPEAWTTVKMGLTPAPMV
ncbi:MAG TPA: hypothetical protein VH678_11465 [Xanthobacteraceae bacterium]